MPDYYEFKVSLKDIRPPIWRRFLLRTDATFADLHDAIQMAFEWHDDHLWDFCPPKRQGPIIAGHPECDDPGCAPSMRRTPEAHLIRLATYFTGEIGHDRCEYLYDFGDRWLHDVKLVAVRTLQDEFHRRLLAGRQPAPLEDSGGAPGHDRMMYYAKTGEDPWGDPEDAVERLDHWRPPSFDLAGRKARFDR